VLGRTGKGDFVFSLILNNFRFGKGWLKGAILPVVLVASSAAFAHEQESRIAVELEKSGPITAGLSTVEFQLVDTKLNKLIKDTDLKITHEKILHVLFYDPALMEFRHVHPEFKGSAWRVEVDPSVNGEYFFWAQGTLSSDNTEFSSFVRLAVTGGSPAWPTPPLLTNVREGSDRGAKVTLDNTNLRAGRMSMLMIDFSRDDGSAPAITPYLGAIAHVVAVSDDGDSLIHVHPVDGNRPNQGMIHATFPRAGFYRLWVQYLDDGILRIIPLSVEVLP
jgi:hypothetical protein